MTTEACTTKLAYILGRGVTKLVQISSLLLQPMRGEISSIEMMGKKFFTGDNLSDNNLKLISKF